MTTLSETAPVSPRSRRPRATRAVVMGVAVVLIGGLVAGLWQWRTSADVFEPVGVEYVYDAMPVGQATYVGITSEEHGLGGEIRIRDLAPDLGEDGAKVRVEYFVCTVDPLSGVGSVGAVGEPQIQEECSELVPAEGHAMTLNATPHQQVVMVVTPTRSGTTHIDGSSISYDHGWRVGTKHIPVALTVTSVG